MSEPLHRSDDGIPEARAHDSLPKRWEYRLKRLLLALLRSLTATPSRSGAVLSAESKVLFIRLNRIGDALIATALLHAVRERLGCQVHVYADAKNEFIFRGHPDVERVFVYRKRLSDFWSFRRLCRREKYTAVVDCHDDVSTTVTFLVALSGAPYRIGLYRPGNHTVFTHTYRRIDPAKTHVLDRLLQLTEAFGFRLPADEGNVYYPIPDSLREDAQKAVRSMYSSSGFRVGVNLSAGSPARFWGELPYRRLVENLLQEGVQPILLGLPSDAALAVAIAPEAPFFARADFAAFSALLPELDLLFTPDTSLVHVASAYHVPVVALYVHNNPNLMYWYPYRSEYRAITTPDLTLEELPFDQVWAVVAPFLAYLRSRSGSSPTPRGTGNP